MGARRVSEQRFSPPGPGVSAPQSDTAAVSKMADALLCIIPLLPQRRERALLCCADPGNTANQRETHPDHTFARSKPCLTTGLWYNGAIVDFLSYKRL